MYNVYVKRKIFVITEIVHMNAGVSSESQSQSLSHEGKRKGKRVSVTVTKGGNPCSTLTIGCRVGGLHTFPIYQTIPDHFSKDFIT